MKKHLGITSLLAGLFLSTVPASARDWDGGNGTEDGLDWSTPAHWSGDALPAPGEDALFLNGANLTVLVSGGTSANSVITQENTTVTFKLSAPTLPGTATLTLSTFLDVGRSDNPIGTSPSLVTVTGSGGVLHSNALRVGMNSNFNGNKLVFTNGVVATSALSNSGSSIGYAGSDNLLQVEMAAKVTVDNVSIGSAAGGANNRVVVTGNGSQFTVGGTGSNRGLRVGTGKAGTSYANGMQNNFVHVADGGKLLVTGLNTTGTINVNIGGQTKAHDNYILVEGANSVFELGKGTSNGSTTLTIGNGADHGGNYLEIRDGGSLLSLTGHTGAITINSHDSSDPDAQASNRLTVGDGGTVSVGGAINVAGGLLQLSSEGSLTAAKITVKAGGRFEAAGDGFLTTGAGSATTIESLGTLAVQEETLSLRTGVTLADGATLEVHLLDGQTAAGIDFLAGGKLTIGSTTKLSLVLDNPGALYNGASWQLFTGATLGNMTGTFNFTLADLPTLDNGLLWDYSGFNQNGNWTLAVVPEPQSVVLLCAGLALLALRAFPRKQQTCVS